MDGKYLEIFFFLMFERCFSCTRNFSIRLDSCYRQTNNVAEIRAVIEAIETVKNLGNGLIGGEFRWLITFWDCLQGTVA